jgi:hypothetical protein
MSQSVSDQHPAVVLRSHYNHMRALLAAATVALVVLAITVGVLAVDSNGGGSSTAGAQQVTSPVGSTTDHGHPDEGTRFIAPSTVSGR